MPHKSIDSNAFMGYPIFVTEEYLTVQEAALELGITEVSVRSALNQNRLPFAEKFGRKLVNRDDLEAYKQRTQPSGVKKVGRPRKAQKATTGKT